MREVIERVEADGVPVQESVRRMSRLLMLERGGATTDDSTLLMIEWTGAPADDLASPADHVEPDPQDGADAS